MRRHRTYASASSGMRCFGDYLRGESNDEYGVLSRFDETPADRRGCTYRAGLIHKPATANAPSLATIAYRIEESWPLGEGRSARNRRIVSRGAQAS